MTPFLGKEECVNISITNDMDIECEDVFTVNLTSSESVVSIPNSRAQSTVTIEMDPTDGWFVLSKTFMVHCLFD